MNVGFCCAEVPLPKFHDHEFIVPPFALDASLNCTACPSQELETVNAAVGIMFRNTYMVSFTALHNPFPVVVSTKYSVSLSETSGV